MVAIAGFLFFQVTEPLFAKIQELQMEKEKLNVALDNAKKLRQVQEELLTTYNSFPPESLERLHKLLPDNIDNVRLIIDIDNIAARYGMSIKDIRIKTDEAKEGEEAAVSERGPIVKGTVTLGFSVSGAYGNFQSFMVDLAKSLRVVDALSVSFAATETNLYNYAVEIKTHWLK
jgi:Tfp pilus assembly protein PilO